MQLPIKILNQPVPKWIKKDDTRGTENIGKWGVHTRPGGLLVGLVQSVASPRRTGRFVLSRKCGVPKRNAGVTRNPYRLAGSVFRAA
jgi:hypothetical protein